ncbi:MAG: sulfotransferase [Planctomycetaceae bacterium]|nr:sulfotransferase [Planctomycetaceae bacterium]
MSRAALARHPGAGLRVVYIMGASRCGSTALSSLLGAQQAGICAGELNQLPRSGWLQDDYCSCGRRCTQCPFWNAVRDEWHLLCPDADVHDYVRLQSKFERLRSWPRLRLAAMWKSTAFRAYLRLTGGLLGAISSVSGRSIIVDSSKGAVRPWALACLPGVDVRVIHLVRDVRATAWSQAKSYERDPRNGVPTEKPSRAVWKSSLEWVLANMLAEQCTPSGRRLLIRYEDLVRQPEQALNGLQAGLELDLQAVISAVDSGEAVPVGHQIAGNRLRMQGSVRLRADRDWITAMPIRDRETCWRMAGWLARRYGYSRNRLELDNDDDGSAGIRSRQRGWPNANQFELVSSEQGVPCSNG